MKAIISNIKLISEKISPIKNMSIQFHYVTSKLFGIVLIFTCMVSNAQTPITLKASIDTALKNNRLLKNEKLKVDYQNALIKTGINIPTTFASVEYGQINSAYKDTKFGLSQSINFPTVYSKQKSILNEVWKSEMMNISVKEIELKKQVSKVFYMLYYLMEKEKLLKKNDTIYSEFLLKSQMRFNAGESNLMEKITAETQQGQIRIQLKQIENDIGIIRLQFQYLLNSTTLFTPAEEQFRLNFTLQSDTSFLSSHPTIKLLEQQKLLSESNTSLEKSRLLPDLTIAYNNMSMQGVGADNKAYSASTRFQSGQFGIGIPLFYGAQKAKIKASKINEQIAYNNYRNGLWTIQNDYEKALMEYLKTYQTVDYYETTVLQNVSTIIQTANRQFNSGEINYLEFVIFTNQAINLQNEYIDAVKSLNERIIELAYLSNTN